MDHKAGDGQGQANHHRIPLPATKGRVESQASLAKGFLFLSRVLDFDYRQLMFAGFWFVTLFVFMSLTLVGWNQMLVDGVWSEDSWWNKIGIFTITISIYSAFPSLGYLVIFTRFNNPFRKKEELK